MIDFLGRGDMIEVAIAEGHVFSSAFSGNTVQICPGRRAYLDPVPFHRSSVGPRPGGVHVHDLLGWLSSRCAVVFQQGDAVARNGLRSGQPELAL